MPAQIGSLVVTLSLNSGQYAQGWGRAEAVTNAGLARVGRNAGVAERSVERFWGTTTSRNIRPYSLIAVSRAFDNASDRAGLLRGSLLATTAVLGGFAAALSSNVVLRYADSFTSISNLLRVVSSDHAEAAAKFELLRDVAERSRSSLEATAILYARLQRGADSLGAEKILRYVETISKALVLGGATAQEARSAAIQFSQAIASNRLGGEELRAILETPLGLELAKGLGVTIGKFREMGHAGELTADVIFKSLEKIGISIDEKFTKSIRTLDQALIQVDNQLTAYFGTTNKAYGGTQLLADGVLALGRNLDTIIPTLGTIGGLLASTFLARSRGVLSAGAGGLIGGFIGNEIAGVQGAIAGLIGGGFLGLRSPELFKGFKEGAEAAATNVRNLTSRVGDLRKAYLGAQAAALAANVAAKGDVTKFIALSSQKDLSRADFKANKTGDSNDIAAAQRLRYIAVAEGQKAARQEILKTGKAYTALGTELRAVEAQLVSATRATTALGRAKLFLSAQVSSLIGFFGGPWGIALTGAIAALGFFAINAQKRAQQIAEARAVMQRELEEIAAEQGAPVEEKNIAQRSLSDERRKQIEGEIEGQRRLAAAAQRTFEQLGGQFDRLQQRATVVAGAESPLALYAKGIGDLLDELRNGAIGAAEFDARLSALNKGLPDNDLGPLVDGARAAAEEIAKLSLVIRRLQGDIAATQKTASEPITIGLEEREVHSADADKLLAGLDRSVYLSGIRAKGLTTEAKAWEIFLDAVDEGIPVTYDAIYAKQKQIDANEKAAAALTKEGKAVETLGDRLARLKAESEGAFLGDIDREVVRQARELKVAVGDIRSYIDGARSGDFSAAPAKLVELRDAETYTAAAESARGIVEQYGSMAQIAPMAAEKQRELAVAVQEGAISADQAAIAYADFLGQFAAYSWIDDITGAIGDFARTAITDFGSIGEAASNLAKRFADIALEILVIEPLVRSLRGAIGGGTSGGGIGGILGGIGSFIGSLFGGGGAPMNLLPGRAGGGSVTAGGLYAVNEEGLELFSPGRSGTIIPHDVSSRMLAGAASGVAGGGFTVSVEPSPLFDVVVRDAAGKVVAQNQKGEARRNIRTIREAQSRGALR